MNLVTHHLDMAWNRRFSGPSWTEGAAEREERCPVDLDPDGCLVPSRQKTNKPKETTAKGKKLKTRPVYYRSKNDLKPSDRSGPLLRNRREEKRLRLLQRALRGPLLTTA